MSENIWQFSNEQKYIKSPYEILFDYASRVKNETGGIIEGIVTEAISDAKEEIVYALYLIVPELRNYSYRLIEVVQPNVLHPYPVSMKLFGKDPGNIISRNNVSAQQFEEELEFFIKNSMTKTILNGLKTHLDIKKQYDD